MYRKAILINEKFQLVHDEPVLIFELTDNDYFLLNKCKIGYSQEQIKENTDKIILPSKFPYYFPFSDQDVRSSQKGTFIPLRSSRYPLAWIGQYDKKMRTVYDLLSEIH